LKTPTISGHIMRQGVIGINVTLLILFEKSLVTRKSAVGWTCCKLLNVNKSRQNLIVDNLSIILDIIIRGSSQYLPTRRPSASSLKRQAHAAGMPLSRLVLSRLGTDSGAGRWPEGFFEKSCGFLVGEMPEPDERTTRTYRSYGFTVNRFLLDTNIWMGLAKGNLFSGAAAPAGPIANLQL